MPYKHNQLKDIKKTSENNPKVICSSSLAVIWGLLLSRQVIWKQNSGNKY